MAEDTGDIGRTPAKRPEVIAALRRQGVSGAVAADLWRLAVELQRRTRRRGLEHAVTLDRENGEQPGPMLTGTPSSTDLSPHLQKLRAGREYVVLRTHPRSTSFSDRDVRVLAEHASLKTMIAVGIDGTWYIMSRPGDTSRMLAAEIETEYLIERSRLLALRVPLTEGPHLVMQHIAQRYAWEYDFVQGGGHESTDS